MKLMLVLLLLSVLIPLPAFAQDCGGSEGVDEAVAFLGMLSGVPPIPGEVCIGQTRDRNAPAEYDPNTQRITINLDKLGELLPDVDDLEERGGIIAILIYHELKHVDGSYGRTKCDDIGNTHHTASQHRALIAFICSVLPNTNIGTLCDAYNAIRDCYNNGCATDGAASEWQKHNCSGSFPGPIPPSGTCESAGPSGECPQ